MHFITWQDTKQQGCWIKTDIMQVTGGCVLYLHCHGHHVMCVVSVSSSFVRFPDYVQADVWWVQCDQHMMIGHHQTAGTCVLTVLYTTVHTDNVLYTTTLTRHGQPSRNRMGRVHAWTTSFSPGNKALTWLDPCSIEYFPWKMVFRPQQSSRFWDRQTNQNSRGQAFQIDKHLRPNKWYKNKIWSLFVLFQL